MLWESSQSNPCLHDNDILAKKTDNKQDKQRREIVIRDRAKRKKKYKQRKELERGEGNPGAEPLCGGI